MQTEVCSDEVKFITAGLELKHSSSYSQYNNT